MFSTSKQLTYSSVYALFSHKQKRTCFQQCVMSLSSAPFVILLRNTATSFFISFLGFWDMCKNNYTPSSKQKIQPGEGRIWWLQRAPSNRPSLSLDLPYFNATWWLGPFSFLHLYLVLTITSLRPFFIPYTKKVPFLYHSMAIFCFFFITYNENWFYCLFVVVFFNLKPSLCDCNSLFGQQPAVFCDLSKQSGLPSMFRISELVRGAWGETTYPFPWGTDEAIIPEF